MLIKRLLKVKIFNRQLLTRERSLNLCEYKILGITVYKSEIKNYHKYRYFFGIQFYQKLITLAYYEDKFSEINRIFTQSLDDKFGEINKVLTQGLDDKFSEINRIFTQGLDDKIIEMNRVFTQNIDDKFNEKAFSEKNNPVAETDWYNSYLYNNRTHEFHFITNCFSNINLDTLIFLRLLSGLDKKSAATVCLILRRVEMIKKDHAQEHIDLFTHAEKEILDTLRTTFYGSILPLQNNIFVYKNMLLSNEHFTISVFEHEHGLHELEKRSFNQINEGNIIDVGGYIGDSALIFRDNFPNSKIFSFEAQPENIASFKKTLELNNLANVAIIPYALSDSKTDLFINSWGSGSRLVEQQYDTFKVEATTLDLWVKENNISDIKLIKVDIEGAEQAFLRGAKETITSQRPIMLISIYHSWDDFLNIKPMIESWDLNYKFKISRPTDGQILLETLLICEPM